MLDELIFAPEVVWTYLWQINFFFPEILKVPLGTGLLKSKKKNCGKKCAPHGSFGGPQFMNCSWIIQLVHELFMCSNSCCEYLDISRLLNILWTCSWTVHEHVQKKKIIWIEDPVFPNSSGIQDYGPRESGLLDQDHEVITKITKPLRDQQPKNGLTYALHRTNFGGTIEPKKFAKSTLKEHEKGNWYKRTSGFLGLNLFLEKKIKKGF